MKILITGVAGFIGFSLAESLLKKNYNVIGLDNLNNYYSKSLKIKRLKLLSKFKNFSFKKIDITNRKELNKISKINFKYIFHFAAQPGVRYSLVNPDLYYRTNVIGFQNVLDAIKTKSIKKIIYASSSSVYGEQKKFPVNENMSLKSKNPYGLSKIINEYIAEFFSKKTNIQCIGLRLFTVYGPWGRPDMFIIKLLNTLKKKNFFYLNNSGNNFRDFTFIDDVVNVCQKILKIKFSERNIIFNLCSGNTVNILDLSKKINKKFNYKSNYIKNIKANKADVYKTFGDNRKLKKNLNYKKFTKINFGLNKTIQWFFKNNLKL
jgi:UDP-glucuronate 4-epimerase